MSLHNPFRTLRYRDFRLLWTGEVLRTSSQWMDTLTRSFLIWELTGSEAQMALVNAARSAPLLVVGLIAGVLADRMSRKKLLLSSQSLNVAASLVLAGLVFSGWAQAWHVYVTVLVVGFGMAINVPARQSLIPSLVPDDEVQSAVVLNTATLNIGQAVGPVIGGAVIGLWGLPAAFLVQAAIVATAGLLISRMVVPEQRTPATEPWRDSARNGLRYLLRHEVLLGLFILSLAPMILVQPFRGIVPAITVQQLMADATITGLLMAALGLGALTSVLALASLPPVSRPWRHVVVSAGAFSLAIAVFAVSGNLALTAVALFVAGAAQANNRTLTQSLLLSEADAVYRGRISSLWVVNRGTMPLGSLILAAGTGWWDAPTAMAVMSLASVLVTVAVALRVRQLWSRA